MWMTLAAMTLSNSMILVDQTAVPLATPDAIRDLEGSLSQSQWLLTANILPTVTAGIALVGAIVCFLLVRKSDRVTEGPIFGRRSRWVSANVGRTPGVTRCPPPEEERTVDDVSRKQPPRDARPDD
jgi:hypothetical protein